MWLKIFIALVDDLIHESLLNCYITQLLEHENMNPRMVFIPKPQNFKSYIVKTPNSAVRIVA